MIRNSLLRPLFAILGAALFLQACTAIPVEQRADKRAELNRVAEETIALMVKQDPDLSQALEKSEGYFVSRVSSANVAVIGGAQGIGVLVDNTSGDCSYLNVKRFDLGAGLGVRYFRVLVLIETREAFEEIRRGKTFQSRGRRNHGGRSRNRQYRKNWYRDIRSPDRGEWHFNRSHGAPGQPSREPRPHRYRPVGNRYPQYRIWHR